MALSLSDIRTLVKDNIHNDASAGNARVDQWINLAQDDIERAFLSRWISSLGTPFSTVADTQEYTLVIPDFRAFIQFWQTDSPIKLVNIPYEEFIRLEPDASSGTSGKPQWWTFLRFTSGLPTISLYPIPDTAYTINFEYAANLADLANDGDVSLISELGWASALINGATWRYYKIHNQEAAQTWERAFRGDIDDFKRELRQDISTRRVMVDILQDQNIQVSSLFRLPSNFPNA